MEVLVSRVLVVAFDTNLMDAFDLCHNRREVDRRRTYYCGTSQSWLLQFPSICVQCPVLQRLRLRLGEQPKIATAIDVYNTAARKLRDEEEQ